MPSRPRAARILLSLVVSMTVGSAVLMALDRNSISAGAFSLASYSSLEPISSVIDSRRSVSSDRWDRIEIFYSNTRGGNLEQIASLSGLSSPEDLNIHFLVCNSLGALDGQIQPTEKWLNQWSALQGGNWYGSSRTIRICVIGREKDGRPSDCQLTRTAELTDALSRQFGIKQSKIFYPEGWEL